MAIIKNKHVTFSLVLLCLIVVSPMAKAQLLNLVNVPLITGVLSCTVNGAPLNGTSTLAFVNAIVQLQCGSQNTVVSETTTNVAGIFMLSTNALSIPAILSGCRLVVPTPRASCNATLPSTGQLVSPLNLVGSLVSGILNIVPIVPAGFVPTN
ncbi:PREDICTED: phylloplanin-like [Camelina sativa]|uniref:Phylloplanin-like n=1 Tax=Camelina sativa TaxID=90675 RepID=A0ABM0XL24_CAMSA|nr:PREDICTED: phylloplanin-like [Camelina sativa]